MNNQIDTSPLPSPAFVDHRGERYHRLLVIAFDRHVFHSGTFWKCLCECGNTITCKISAMKSGHTKSCGCASREHIKLISTTHGMSESSEYRVYKAMIRRCYYVNSDVYRYYGGRGIRVCDRWRHDFVAFYADMGPRPSVAHSIDRQDDNGDYSPENCHWATKQEQANNQRNNRLITYNGETHTLAEWARRLNIPFGRLQARLDRGTPIEIAMTGGYLPTSNQRRKK